jgi:hypothetical protein
MDESWVPLNGDEAVPCFLANYEFRMKVCAVNPSAIQRWSVGLSSRRTAVSSYSYRSGFASAIKTTCFTLISITYYM